MFLLSEKVMLQILHVDMIYVCATIEILFCYPQKLVTMTLFSRKEHYIRTVYKHGQCPVWNVRVIIPRYKPHLLKVKATFYPK